MTHRHLSDEELFELACTRPTADEPESCPRCAREFGAWRTTLAACRDAFAAAPEAEDSASLATRVLARTTREDLGWRVVDTPR